MKIRVLDEKVINRIAAGEVIERPASVVKELIENAIDAKARLISLEVEQGGKKLIRVKDDGMGMSPDDAFLALERHATSKLTSEKDLVSIATMGFRGEALASIGSIARMRLLTKDDSEAPGSEIIMEGGVIRKAGEIGMGRGTIIEVAHLFYNVPVRRKFLKSPQVEADYIRDLAARFALAYPGIAFRFVEDGRVKIDAPAVPDLEARVHALYSKDVRENLAAVDHRVGAYRLSGYVSRPPYSRAGMRSVFTFINGRSVKDRLVNAALNQAFAHTMERGRYPLAFLLMEIPAEDVDVNVHPQKAEVRFLNPRHVSELIVEGVQAAFMGSRPARAPFPYPAPQGTAYPYPTAHEIPDAAQPVSYGSSAPGAAPSPGENPWDSPFPPGEAGPAPEGAPCDDPEESGNPDRGIASDNPIVRAASELPRFAHLGILGRLPESFVALYDDSDLIILDQHAAHERLLFDRLMESRRSNETCGSQTLLIPHVVECDAVEARAIERHLELLQSVGFRIERFGEFDFAIKGVPEWWGGEDPERFIRSLADVFHDTGVTGNPDALREEMLKQMACKGAVKETGHLKPEEIRALLADLDAGGSAPVCPHGRPFVMRISFAEIRRRMGRK